MAKTQIMKSMPKSSMEPPGVYPFPAKKGKKGKKVTKKKGKKGGF